jgi:hypothetical protein
MRLVHSAQLRANVADECAEVAVPNGAKSAAVGVFPDVGSWGAAVVTIETSVDGRFWTTARTYLNTPVGTASTSTANAQGRWIAQQIDLRAYRFIRARVSTVGSSGVYLRVHVCLSDWQPGFQAGPSLSGLSITSAAVSSSSVRWTIQTSEPGRYVLQVSVSATQYAAPSATGNTVAFTTGTVWRTRTAHADYDVLTSSAGAAVLTVDVTGPATRWVSAVVLGRIADSSGAYVVAGAGGEWHFDDAVNSGQYVTVGF